MNRRVLAILVIVGAIGLEACSRTPREDKTEIHSATIVPNIGSLAGEVEIRENAVPSADALPHDPAVAPDGALWVTEQTANKLGRLDPKTGVFREYGLKIADSGPHGLTVDEAGNVWFTANSKGYIGKLVPASEDVTQYPVPGAKDPHTPLLGPNGILWFTAQQSNVVGKLDRRTGHVDLVPIPTRHALPYGIALGMDGAPYACEFGANKIARIDPTTLAVREYPLPVGARPRRIALGVDGTLFYTDYERGRLGRLDPKSGVVDEWLSPGGPLSKPYGIAITPEGRVWYSESGVEPNTLVRFEPTTKAFARIAIPAGGGVVRNMAPTLDGKVFLAESAVNKVAIVTPRR
jgi:virginiamycin B lyase